MSAHHDSHAPSTAHDDVTGLSGRPVILEALTHVSGRLVLSALLAAVWSLIGRHVGAPDLEYDDEPGRVTYAATMPDLQAAAPSFSGGRPR